MPVKLFFIYLFIINLAAFCAYGADKLRAVQKRWRIPERKLLGFAAAGGALGALLGMLVFRHKIRKGKFLVVVPGCLILYLAVAVYILLTCV